MAKNKWYFRVPILAFVVLSTSLQSALAVNVDLSALLPSRWYWFAHITSAGHLKLIALVNLQHATGNPAEGSTLHFYPLHQTVSSLRPGAADILNANWHQQSPVSIQLTKNVMSTVYSVTHGMTHFSVQARGIPDIDPSCTSGAVRRRSRLQLLGVWCSELINGYLGVATYSLWHAWYHIMAPHSSFSVFHWLLTSTEVRARPMPQPPLAVPDPVIDLSSAVMRGVPVQLGGIKMSLLRPWRSMSIRGIAQQDAPSIPAEAISRKMSRSPENAIMSIINKAVPLCGGLRQTSVRGHGNALIWRCPMIVCDWQRFHGGYLGLISHGVLMRTRFFRGSRSERERLNHFEPDFQGKKDDGLLPDKN